MSRKEGIESGRRRSMTPNFYFEVHIRMLKVICCRSKKKFVGLVNQMYQADLNSNQPLWLTPED